MTARQSSGVRREILRHILRAIVDDMSAALEHNSSSETVSEARDYAVAFTTTTGEVVIAENAVHMPSLAMTAQAIFDYYEFNLKAGNLVVTNDPYSGGIHTQDLTVFAPVYAREELLGALLVRVHGPDFGGQVAGGYNPPALELWAEGVRFKPVKLARFGRTDKDVHRTILLNSRLPDQVDRLLDAMLAALALGQERVQQMVSRYGFETFVDGIEYTLQYSEAAARSVLRQWPTGSFSGEAALGHDCTGRSPAVRCTLTVEDGALTVDFSGSDPQSASFVNSSWPCTCGSALLPVVACLGEEIPINSGLLRAIRFAAPEGTLVRPAYPAAAGWGPIHPGAEIINAVSAALSACTGLSLPAVPPHALVSCCFANYRVFSLDALAHPGAGATSEASGWGPPSYFARRRLPSIEKSEIAFPEVLVEHLELATVAQSDGSPHGAARCELTVTLRAPAALTACIEWAGEPSGRDGTDRPRLFIRSQETETAIDAFCAEQALACGVLKLVTAAGPAAREATPAAAAQRRAGRKRNRRSVEDTHDQPHHR